MVVNFRNSSWFLRLSRLSPYEFLSHLELVVAEQASRHRTVSGPYGQPQSISRYTGIPSSTLFTPLTGLFSSHPFAIQLLFHPGSDFDSASRAGRGGDMLMMAMNSASEVDM